MLSTNKHEEKACPRCGEMFECKPGSITECQCFGIVLNDEVRGMISVDYNDCICQKCLLQLASASSQKA